MSNTNGSSLRLDIQGLRALAVLFVMIYHAKSSWLPAGFLGVDVFFVVSGFVVSRMLFQGEYTWLSFVVGRVKRIFPAYLVLLVGVSCFATVFLIEKDFDFFRDSLKSALFFNSNSYFAGFGDYYAPSSHELPLLHTWSLAVEMQFYFVLSVVLTLAPVRFLKFILPLFFLLFIGFDFLVLQDSRGSGSDRYYSLATRIPEFLVGVIVAFFYKHLQFSRRVAPFVGGGGLILILVSVFFMPQKYVPGIMALIPCMGVALIILSSGPVSNFLSNKILVWIGALSYSLYLWHWPILAFTRYINQTYELSFFYCFFYFVFSFLFAWVSYEFVETPLRRLKNTRGVMVVTMLMVLPVFFILKAGGGVNDALVGKLSGEYTFYGDPKLICHNQLLDDCVKGERGAKRKVLVFGDSHAGQLNYFFDYIGRRNEIAFTVISSGLCVPVSGFPMSDIPEYASNSCAEQVAFIERVIPEYDAVVLAGRWYAYNKPGKIEAVMNFLNSELVNGKRVVVLSQVPETSGDIIRSIRHGSFGIQSGTHKTDKTNASNDSLRNKINGLGNRNLVYLDLYEEDLFKSAPIYQGQTIYYDNSHLNKFGAIEYAKYSERHIVDVIYKIY